jgi:epoxyqueuosine reductase
LDFLKKIEEIVEDYGFFLGGIVPLHSSQENSQVPNKRDPEFSFFKDWLEEGRHGTMAFLERHQDLREFPQKIDIQMKSAIAIGLVYGKPESKPKSHDHPRVAQYARYGDYHRVFWRLGSAMLAEIHQAFGSPDAVGRVCCDSAPLLERSIAVQAGLGFRGKNTCVINRQKGSLFFIGELLTSLDLKSLAPKKHKEPQVQQSSCGTCKRCQVHCPTGALDRDYRMDARKCIAYWTIEHRGPIPEVYWPTVGMYIFGCDICQLVCPFNRVLRLSKEGDLTSAATKKAKTPLVPRIEQELDLYGVATMTQSQYEAWFGGTPLTRAKREGLMRNGLIALYVKDRKIWQVAFQFLRDWGETPEALKETLQQMEQIIGNSI